MTEAYQATPASTLEAEAHVPLLNLYLDSMVIWATQHLEDSERACQEVHHYLQTHGQNQQRHFTEYIHPSHCPRDGSLDGFRMARQPGYFSPDKRVSGGLKECPEGSFIHSPQRETV